MTQILKAPFPWFGGKSRAAHLIWPRFGDVPNYVEPFAGSLAVLLARPHPPKIETVNDKDCYLANFWRALQRVPDEVARWADWPVNEANLHARHWWLLKQADFRERMISDPDYYDAKVAGWWVWGICAWIGGGWCAEDCYSSGDDEAGRGKVNRPSLRRPHLVGRGVHRQGLQRPHLGDRGVGVHKRDLQQLSPDGTARNDALLEYFCALAARLRFVRVCCGDWTRILGTTPTTRLGTTAVLLDPPYSAEAGRANGLYGVEDLTVAHAVRQWAIEHGDDPLLRIALCGYDGEHDHEMPADWERVAWKTPGGYGLLGDGRGLENRHREVIWFSPHCLRPAEAPTLFGVAGR